MVGIRNCFFHTYYKTNNLPLTTNTAVFKHTFCESIALCCLYQSVTLFLCVTLHKTHMLICIYLYLKSILLQTQKKYLVLVRIKHILSTSKYNIVLQPLQSLTSQFKEKKTDCAIKYFLPSYFIKKDKIGYKINKNRQLHIKILLFLFFSEWCQCY